MYVCIYVYIHILYIYTHICMYIYIYKLVMRGALTGGPNKSL